MLDEALNQALVRGVLIVAAAGNQGTFGQFRHYASSMGYPGSGVRCAWTSA